MDAGTDRFVGRTALAASIGLVLVVMGTFAVVLSPPVRDWLRQQLHWSPPSYRVGEASGFSSAWHGASDYTLLIFARRNCSACQTSKPFHLRLVSATEGNPRVRAWLVVTTPDADDAAYAAEMGLGDDQIAHIDAGTTKLRRLPTIILVDRLGVVVTKSEGVLPEAEQHALLETLSRLTR